MKVLIEIPEKVFNEIVSADDTSHLSRAFLRGSYLYFKEALQNGTPLDSFIEGIEEEIVEREKHFNRLLNHQRVDGLEDALYIIDRHVKADKE